MTDTPAPRSSCCNAEMRTFTEWFNSEDLQHHTCSKCGKPCEPSAEPPSFFDKEASEAYAARAASRKPEMSDEEWALNLAWVSEGKLWDHHEERCRVVKMALAEGRRRQAEAMKHSVLNMQKEKAEIAQREERAAREAWAYLMEHYPLSHLPCITFGGYWMNRERQRGKK